MLIRSAPIDPVQLSTGAAAIYTVPSKFKATIKQLTVTNVNAAARTITLYRVPSGGSPGATNTLISGMTIPPAGQGQISLAYLLAGQVLNEGDTLQALASANSSLDVMGGVIEETV